MFKLVSFDFWCTLVCFNLKELNKMKSNRLKWFYGSLTKKGYNVSEESVEHAIKSSRIDMDKIRFATNKEFNTTQTVESILSKLDIKNDCEIQNELEDVYSKAMLSMEITLQPKAIEILNGLRQKNIKIGLISNTEHGEAERILLEEFNLTQYFNLLIFSCEVGVREPGAEIFNKLLTGLNTDCTEAVHVGDRLIDDVFGAKQSGIKAIYLQPPFNYHEKQLTEPDIIIKEFAELPSALSKICACSSTG